MIPAGFHPEAAQELEAAALHYEKIRPKLGQDFLASFEQALLLIRKRPGAWRKLRPRLYRVLLRRFPYGVVYQKTKDKLQILAVYHCAREPDYWMRRGVESKPENSEQNERRLSKCQEVDREGGGTKDSP